MNAEADAKLSEFEAAFGGFRNYSPTNNAELLTAYTPRKIKEELFWLLLSSD